MSLQEPCKHCEHVWVGHAVDGGCLTLGCLCPGFRPVPATEVSDIRPYLPSLELPA